MKSPRFEHIPQDSEPLPEENIFQTLKEKKALRQAAISEDAPESVKMVASSEAAKIEGKLAGWIDKEGGLKKARERMRSDKGKAESLAESGYGIDEIAVEKSLGDLAPAFKEITEYSDKLEDMRDFEMQRMFEVKTDPHAKRAHESLLQTARKERRNIEAKLETLEKDNPKAFRSHELIRDAEGLRQEGHIAPTASVRANLEKIGRNMLVGKSMFLHGPTGTGKTSLARFAAEHFTGEPAQMVYCNPQTRESSVWGKTGIRPAHGEAGKYGGIETVDIFGPLAKAMNEGKAVIFDEFSALPREQMVFIKGIFNAKPGDEVNIVGNGRIKIAQGFQMIFTANLKSEKNPERQELPPEIAREFEQNNIKIGYLPKDEAYDVMLSRMMNQDGSVDASWHDLNETMPKLCEAMEEIQTAYAGITRSETARLVGAADASGKTQGLKKFVMTQGTVEAMLEGWKLEKTMNNPTSFAEFIDQRLKIGLTFEEYSLADRTLAAKILASKGFLRTLSEEDLGLPKNTFNFEAARKLRGDRNSLKELAGESAKEINVPLKELADLDPFGVRKSSAAEEARQMAEASKKAKAGKKGKREGAEAAEGEVSMEEAKEIMGVNFLGPEEAEEALGLRFEGEIPAIPFPKEILEKMKDTHQLILYPDMLKDAADKIVPVISDDLYEYLDKKKKDGTKLLYDTDWYKNETFFKRNGPEVKWKLVSKELIPNSTSKNYLEQTDVLCEYVKNTYDIEDIDEIPIEVMEAMHEWDDLKRDTKKFEELKRFTKSDNEAEWKSASDTLEKLKLTQMFRESFIEWFYRTALTERATGERLLPNKYSWTKSRGSHGSLVDAGDFDGDGGFVNGWRPRNLDSNVGCAFSAEKL